MFYDSNDAQISGKVSRSDSTDYALMFKSHGWHVQEIDGHNHNQIRSAIRIAQMEIEKPSIIIGKTVMAKGSANMEGDHNTHGAPMPHEEIAATKKKLGLNPEEFFYLPQNVLEDVINRYVSIEGAKKDYGVVIRDDLSIDNQATTKARKSL